MRPPLLPLTLRLDLGLTAQGCSDGEWSQQQQWWFLVRRRWTGELLRALWDPLSTSTLD